MDLYMYGLMLGIIIVLVLCVLGLSNRADRFEDELEYAIKTNTRLVNENTKLRRHNRVLRDEVARLRSAQDYDLPVPYVPSPEAFATEFTD